MPQRPNALLSALRSRAPFLCFLIPYAAWVAWTYRDYGVTPDEYAVYWGGRCLWENLTQGLWRDLLLNGSGWNTDVRHYHYAYAAVLYLLAGKLSIPLLHFWNMALGLIPFACVYEMLFFATRRPWASLAGPALLAAMPSFLGALPNDPRDVSAALFFTAFLVCVQRWKARPTPAAAILMGLLLGFAVGARIVSLSLLLIWCGWTFLEARRGDGEAPSEPSFPGWKTWTLLAASSLVLLLSTWPWLRASLFSHAAYLLSLARRFPWDGEVLFDGRLTPSGLLPVSYLPVWFVITLPPLWLLLPGGIPWLAWKRRDPLASLLLVTLALQAALYFILHPALYDGMRHYLFILPAWAAAGALVAIRLWDEPALRRAAYLAAALALIQGAVTARETVRLHPYEYVYFNSFVGGLRGAAGRFETDYRGGSYKESVEWLRDRLPSEGPPAKVFATGTAFQSGYFFDRRMVWAGLDDADYLITNTRDDRHLPETPRQLLYSVDREGVTLGRVYRLHPPDPAGFKGPGTGL